MNPFAVILAICCLATTHARPGYSHGGGGGSKLVGVPDETHYGKLTYPKFDIIDLGTSIKDTLPPSVVQITKQVIVKEPQPYPVKVPYPVPHPVPVAKPYPVVETKIIKVPHPVPYEVIKQVPVPYEVPKPYPIPAEEFKAPDSGAHVASYGGSFGGYGHQKLDEGGVELGHGGGYGGFEGGHGGGYAVQEGGNGGGYGGFEGSHQGGDYAQGDQSGAYGTQVQAQEFGWAPLQGGHDGGDSQQVEEQH